MKTHLMEEGFRWFGPGDPVPLPFIRQAGASAVFTSLHQIPYGELWPAEAIRERKRMIEAAGLRWSVVESVPVHEDLKTGRADWQLTLRPDHGHTMMDDLPKPTGITPGYSCIGRMRGLSELLGLMLGLRHSWNPGR